MSDLDREMVAALGVEEWSRRKRETAADWVAFEARTAPLIAEQGYRWPNFVGEPGVFVWLKIDDRTIDDGLCKVYVVPLA